MNIVFLIGNGFDLNLYLPTRYSDFYKYYQSMIPQSEIIGKFKKDIQDNYQNWVDLEVAFGNYTEQLSNVNEFDEIYKDIINHLGDYLGIIDYDFKPEVVDKEKLLKDLCFPESSVFKADEMILETFKEKWAVYDWNIYIISFNYTRIIEKIIGKINGIQIGTHHNGKKIILRGLEHIHGYVDDRLVLGVNDILQISNKSFRENIEIIDLLIKEKCYLAQKHTIDKLCKNWITNANLICIFGSSLGETDKFWWKCVGEQLKNDCRLLIFHKGNEIAKRLSQYVKREEDNVRSNFYKKTGLVEDIRDQILEKILVSINSEMFNILKKPDNFEKKIRNLISKEQETL